MLPLCDVNVQGPCRGEVVATSSCRYPRIYDPWFSWSRYWLTLKRVAGGLLARHPLGLLVAGSGYRGGAICDLDGAI